jgi:hypothetical protein
MRTDAAMQINMNIITAFQNEPYLWKYSSAYDVYAPGLVPACYPNCDVPPPPTPQCSDEGLCGTYPNCRGCPIGCNARSTSPAATTGFTESLTTGPGTAENMCSQ